jgi:hypothetical protein
VQKKYQRRPYDVMFPDTVVAASGQASQSIKIVSDYDFEWWDTVFTATSSNAKVRMEVNSVSFMNSVTPGNQNGVQLANWGGTAQLPYARRFPWVLHQGDQATLYFTDLSGNQNTIETVLRGFQLIPAES